MKYPDDFLNKIICGDSLEVMKDIPDESINLIFADPPFNIGKEYDGMEDKRSDYYEWSEQWINLCFDKLQKTGSIYVMLIPKHLEKFYPILGSRGVFVNEIHWRNVSAVHSKRGFWNSYQPILFYGKTKDYYFDTYAETKHDMERWVEWDSGPKGQLHDYWTDIPFVFSGSIHHKEAILELGTNRKMHPCQMPEKLATRIIRFSSSKNDIVLDPFVGSGVTAVVAKKLGRRYIGIDTSMKYCKMTNQRLTQEILPL